MRGRSGLRGGYCGVGGYGRPSGGVLIMRRVIAAVACGFAVAACSESKPSLNFLSSSTPPTDEVQFASEPPDAEVKTSSGQTCRTPCELAIQIAPTLSATFALNGYESQTISLRPVPAQPIGTPRFMPNPVQVELRAAPIPPPAKPPAKKKPAVAARTNNTPVTSADTGEPPAATFVDVKAR